MRKVLSEHFCAAALDKVSLSSKIAAIGRGNGDVLAAENYVACLK